MDPLEKTPVPPEKRPVCFGDEASFVAYLEGAGPECRCAGCPSEEECGEFVLLKCSRELAFLS